MTFPDFSPHFSHLAELEEPLEIELDEHSEKGMEILRSTVGTTCTIPSQTSSIIYSSSLLQSTPLSSRPFPL
jgi:hypothetical protein